MKFGVVVFPGSNCDHDAYRALGHVCGQETVFLWHRNPSLEGTDVVVVPGGFSYGDYLRCGAIARFSPIMESIRRHAETGGLVLGICNGFQILQEARLLPGALLRNAGLKFLCQPVFLRTETSGTPFTRAIRKGQILQMPIAHNDGNFYLPESQLQELEERGQVAFRYAEPDGAVTSRANPNGSLNNIAGITNAAGNVLGLMPHPERAAELILGSQDGKLLFDSLLASRN